MDSYHNILEKLNRFSKKYYGKMLMKGALLFLFLGVLFFMGILAVEYFLWLNSVGRLVLLLVFIGVSFFLLYRYLLTPIFYLIRIKRGISNKQASILIGKHFPEVGDKLRNLLDLAEDPSGTELLMASIEQRSRTLKPIPFVNAISLRENLKYVKFLAIPLLIFGAIWLSGNLSSFFGSYNRVVNYDLAYEPPAPFRFNFLSGSLDVLESDTYTARVTTEGELRPEGISIVINGKELFLQEQNGAYQYVFSPPLQGVEFYFSANGIKSASYTLNVLKTPSIQDFRLILDYPDYTNKPTQTVKSTGNATFPEGTRVSWAIAGQHTERIGLTTRDTTLQFEKNGNEFTLSKRIYADFPYQLTTSNINVKDYETLDYNFKVVRDAYPLIKAAQVLDSLNPNISYYVGEASDDYRLRSISLVCFPDDDPKNAQILELARPGTNVDQFYYTFPSGLNLEAGRGYSFYFQATDNDALHKGKTARTRTFNFAVLDSNQLKNKQLEFQQSVISNMDRSLEKFKEQKETLKEINKEQREKNLLNFNDQNKIKDFLKKQQRQEDLMQKFSKQLKENLKKDDQLSELLRERLERQEMKAQKNEKLLEELNRIADKIDKEELTKRLEELGKKQQNSERSLEQLLELTKRYYVTEKTAQLAKDLKRLAEKQNAVSEKEVSKDSEKEQLDLNKAFEELSKEMKELKKENKNLKKPLNINIDKNKEEGVKKDQQEALEELGKEKGDESPQTEGEENGKNSKASQKQKSAAEKMKEMSEQLQQSASGGGGSTITEDAEMLRQILDNLVTFSFKQEGLYDSLEGADTDIAHFSSSVREQRQLRELFEHVDDSLFALSLRRAELAEFVNEQITEVYYNTDKALESMAERQMYQGVAYQQRILTASNSLADFLANVLDNMQQSMKPGAGSGNSSEGFQLPDIIKGQGELKEKMGEMGESGNSKGKGESGEGEGEKGGEGKNKEGKGGEDGNGKQEGSGSGTNGKGEQSEQELKEIYEIYKQQQQLRQQLERQLEDMIRARDKQLAQRLIQQMEDFERDLLENGFTERALNKVNRIQYELLKLENAALKQGKKPERESNTSKNQFQNPVTTRPEQLENYRNEIEILSRQALPLQQIFQDKVKNYFRKND